MFKLHYFMLTAFLALNFLGLNKARAQARLAVPKYSIGVAAMAATGKMGNGLSDAPDRDMILYPVVLFTGFNMRKFRLGLNYEYMMANQTTKPADVANTNTSGKGSSLGLRLEYYDGVQSFGGVYRLSSDYALDKKTAAGDEVKYKGTNGFSVQYMRKIKNRIGFIIDYSSEEFKDSLSSQNIKWSRVGIGIVFANFGGPPGRR
jgi:hypothetical protein